MMGRKKEIGTKNAKKQSKWMVRDLVAATQHQSDNLGSLVHDMEQSSGKKCRRKNVLGVDVGLWMKSKR
jgi:hypothetical protein